MPNVDKQATQCPHCHTAFTVTEEQLSINSGNVRCGACLQTFPALIHRVQLVEAESDDDYDEYAPFELIGLITDEHNQYNPFEQVDVDCKKTEEQHQTTLIDRVIKNKSATAHVDNPKDFERLSEFDYSAFPILNQNAKDDSSIQYEQLIDDDNPSTNEASTLDEITLTLRDAQTSHTHSKPKLNTNIAIEPETIQFQLNPKKTSRLRWGLAVSIIVFLVAVGIPYSWTRYPQLISHLKLPFFLEQFCRIAHCKVPTLQDSHQLHKKGVLIEPHPTAAESFRLTMMIINKATFEQPWPDLTVEFSNLQKTPIFWHTVTPSAYLGGELIDVDRMPSNHPIYITVDFKKPSDQPLGYRVKLVHR